LRSEFRTQAVTVQKGSPQTSGDATEREVPLQPYFPPAKGRTQPPTSTTRTQTVPKRNDWIPSVTEMTQLQFGSSTHSLPFQLHHFSARSKGFPPGVGQTHVVGLPCVRKLERVKGFLSFTKISLAFGREYVRQRSRRMAHCSLHLLSPSSSGK